MKYLFLIFALMMAPMAVRAEPAPLVAHLEDGTSVTIPGFQAGRPTVMKFWATWCHDCRREMPELKALYHTYGDRLNFVLVNVGFNETPAKVAAFLKAGNYDFPFVFDEGAGLLRGLHVFGTPTHVLLDAGGNVVLRTGGLDDAVRTTIRDLANREAAQ